MTKAVRRDNLLMGIIVMGKQCVLELLRLTGLFLQIVASEKFCPASTMEKYYFVVERI